MDNFFKWPKKGIWQHNITVWTTIYTEYKKGENILPKLIAIHIVFPLIYFFFFFWELLICTNYLVKVSLPFFYPTSFLSHYHFSLPHSCALLFKPTESTLCYQCVWGWRAIHGAWVLSWGPYPCRNLNFPSPSSSQLPVASELSMGLCQSLLHLCWDFD